MAVLKAATGAPESMSQNGHNRITATDGTDTPKQTPLFEMSSQFRHWRYSAETLHQAREDLNRSAIQRVKASQAEDKQAKATNGQNVAVSGTSTPTADTTAYLTVADEKLLVTYYLTQLVRLCRAFKFPSHVESTAMTFLKRFYLRNTCMDYHPKNVMLTCLFLASKTENSLLSGGIEAFVAKIPKCTREDVLSLEFVVAQSLKFEFKLHSAEIAGKGIMLDMQTLLAGHADALDRLLLETWPQALASLLSLRTSDAEFIFTPAQLALVCFHEVDPALTQQWLESKMQLAENSKLRKPEQQHGDQAGKEALACSGFALIIAEVAKPIAAHIAGSKQTVDRNAVVDIDRRLRYCTNPEKDPNSALSKKRAAEAEQAAQAKRNKKNGAQMTFDAADPFG